MKTSEQGKELIKSLEGLSLSVYKDIAGVNTVGYGHTTILQVGDFIVMDAANKFLDEDIQKAETNVNKYVDKYNFNQNQYDALVSFAFNIGNIDQLTANGTRDIKTISDKMLEYCMSNHIRVEALYRRRVKEQELFNNTQGTNTQKFYVDLMQFNYATDKDKKVSEHILVKELTGQGKLREQYESGYYKTIYVKSKLIELIEKIRNHYNKPIIINSLYRPADYNVAIGGSKNSQHLTGGAVDFRFENIDHIEVVHYLETDLLKDTGGIGYYAGQKFIHADIRPTKTRWVQPAGANTYKTVPSITI